MIINYVLAINDRPVQQTMRFSPASDGLPPTDKCMLRSLPGIRIKYARAVKYVPARARKVVQYS